MIVEINYTALHWDNYQGGSGRPITGRILTVVDNSLTISELKKHANEALFLEQEKTSQLIGNYILTNIVLDL